jgi:hypothetical protein
MSGNNKTIHETQQSQVGETEQSRKPYSKPQLEELGDLRTLTLGASPSGFKDSSGALYSETFPGGMPPPTP